MIIDSHVHVSDRPSGIFGHPPFTVEELLAYMDGPFTILGRPRRVDLALIQPQTGETLVPGTTVLEQHQYLAQSVRRYPDRLLGCVMVNPHLGLDAVIKDMEHLIKEQGFRAIKLHPTVHAYLPPRNKELLFPIVETAAGLKVPIIIHTGDPPFSVPVHMAPLAEAFPSATIIISHLGTQRITYADEAIYLAKKNENILLETSWATLPRLKEAVATLGSERLVFGTDCPILEIGSQMRTVEVLAWKPPLGMGLDQGSVEKIMGDNMAEILGVR